MFDWDEANTTHVARHGVSPEEAEQALEIAAWTCFASMMKMQKRIGFLQMGVTSAGRVLVAVTTWRGELIRVVSALQAPRSLRRRYWEERRQVHGD
jgi:uncharacterized DUF497 family protein